MEKIIKKILEKIENDGYEAYVVGGYVRDKILGKNSYDVDICTNALPKKLHKLFQVNTKNNYGGFNLKIKKYNIDITTYREEIKYENRKPIEIKYINNLITDIKRRDFTINTLCMNKEGKIIDLLNASDDIKKKIIKMVGNPEIKIKEDPLRIIRAIRFATTLNFVLDDELKKTIKNNSEKVKKLSPIKIRSELNKILLSSNYQYGLNLITELGLKENLELEYDEIKYASDLLVMWSQIKCSDKLFSKTEYDNIKSIQVIIAKKIIDEFVLYQYGLYLCTAAGEILGYPKKYINKIYNNMEINQDKTLQITSQDIMNILNIEPSKKIKEIQNELVELILEKKLKNNTKSIKNYLINRKDHYGQQ